MIKDWLCFHHWKERFMIHTAIKLQINFRPHTRCDISLENPLGDYVAFISFVCSGWAERGCRRRWRVAWSSSTCCARTWAGRRTRSTRPASPSGLQGRQVSLLNTAGSPGQPTKYCRVARLAYLILQGRQVSLPNTAGSPG